MADNESGGGRLPTRSGIKVSAAAIAVILSIIVPITASVITTSYALGGAKERLASLEGSVAELKGEHKALSLVEHAEDYKKLETRADADHDLIIQIAADFRHIRQRLTQEKSQ